MSSKIAFTAGWALSYSTIGTKGAALLGPCALIPLVEVTMRVESGRNALCEVLEACTNLLIIG